MGMAASQARLLSLTGRLHDIELKAQNLESQKINLATRQDKIYQDYCDALDATRYQVRVSDGINTRFVDATYATLCGYDKTGTRLTNYSLRDNKTNKIIVSEEVAKNYELYGNDKYNFAWAMIGFSGNFDWYSDGDDTSATSIGIGTVETPNNHANLNYIPENDGTYSLYMTEVEQQVYDSIKSGKPELVELYDAIGRAESKPDKSAALTRFRNKLYSYPECEKAIFEKMNINKNDSQEFSFEYDFTNMTWESVKNEFNYYANLWKSIEESGGCTSMEAGYESGEEGRIWLQNMVEAGLVTIQVWEGEFGERNGKWADTSFATSTNNNHLQEVQDDTDKKKAEAKYEHEMRLINQKDKEYDTELSKLETERTAITTEMDAMKQVRDDNTERTFGIFS